MARSGKHPRTVRLLWRDIGKANGEGEIPNQAARAARPRPCAPGGTQVAAVRPDAKRRPCGDRQITRLAKMAGADRRRTPQWRWDGWGVKPHGRSARRIPGAVQGAFPAKRGGREANGCHTGRARGRGLRARRVGCGLRRGAGRGSTHRPTARTVRLDCSTA